MEKKDFLILGGDKRQLYAAEKLKKTGYSVTVSGFDKYDVDITAEKNDFSSIEFSDYKYAVLPLPVTRDGVNLNTPLSEKNLPLCEIIEKLTEEHTAFCGMLSDALKERLEKKSIKYFDYFLDKELTEKNAELTAKGTAQVILGELKKGIEGCECVITGYGLTARAIAKNMKALGAQATVAVRREEAAAQAEKDGFKAALLKDISLFSKAELIINTPPALIIDARVIDLLKKDCVIIDIASAPFGVDFEYAHKSGITAVKAQSLPGKYYPEAAGEIIAQTIVNNIKGG